MPEYRSVQYRISSSQLIYIHDDVVHEFNLRPITEDKLIALRVKNSPGFVLKNNDNIYYAGILKPMRFFVHCGYEHLCIMCKRCSALPDERGGCQKIRDFDKSTVLHSRINNLKEQMRYSGQFEKVSTKSLVHTCLPKSIEISKRIEKYPFVTYGFETFGTNTESLVILKCENFEISRRV